MTRDPYGDRLLELAYGELSKREAREVEEHAASCEACRAELARIRGTRRIMAALPEEPAPERGERILLAAAREAAEARRPRRLVPRWLLGGAVVAASIAVVAAVSLRVSEWTPGHREKQSLLESPYATRPPADEAPAAADAPAPAEPGAADPRRLETKPGAEPSRVAVPLGALRREAAKARSREPEREGYASSPPDPTAEAPEREGTLRLDIGPRIAAAPDAARNERRAPSAAPPPAQASASAAPPAAAAPSAGPASASARVGVAARKSAAVPDAGETLGQTSAAPASPFPAEARSFTGCEGESQRRVERDGQGRVVRYVRFGRVDGRRLRIEHAFSPDGRTAGVTVRDLDAPAEVLDPRALGLSLPAGAADAGIDAPPRCGR